MCVCDLLYSIYPALRVFVTAEVLLQDIAQGIAQALGPKQLRAGDEPQLLVILKSKKGQKKPGFCVT